MSEIIMIVIWDNISIYLSNTLTITCFLAIKNKNVHEYNIVTCGKLESYKINIPFYHN